MKIVNIVVSTERLEDELESVNTEIGKIQAELTLFQEYRGKVNHLLTESKQREVKLGELEEIVEWFEENEEKIDRVVH